MGRRKWQPTPLFLPGESCEQRSLWDVIYGVAQSRTRLKWLSSSSNSNSMYGCESWTIKKAEHLRIDAFELWCWIRLLRVPWTARRSNQSILKEISPEYLLEGLMLKLKFQRFGHLTHLKRPWYWETLKVGREGDNRGWEDWLASPTQWTQVWVNSGS